MTMAATTEQKQLPHGDGSYNTATATTAADDSSRALVDSSGTKGSQSGDEQENPAPLGDPQ